MALLKEVMEEEEEMEGRGSFGSGLDTPTAEPEGENQPPLSGGGGEEEADSAVTGIKELNVVDGVEAGSSSSDDEDLHLSSLVRYAAQY